MKLDARHTVVFDGTDRTSRYLGDLLPPVVAHAPEPARTACTDAERDHIRACVLDGGRAGATQAQLASAASVSTDLCQRALGRLLRAQMIRREPAKISPKRTVWIYYPVRTP